MSSGLISIARGGTPVVGALAAVAGAIAGGAGFLSASGAALGALSGLGVIGLSSLIAALIARLSGIRVDGATIERGINSTVTALSLAPGATAGAGAAPLADITTENEAKLMSDGRFAEYHLAKARRAYHAQDYRTALTQAAASLAHGDLAEAAELRTAAKVALR